MVLQIGEDRHGSLKLRITEVVYFRGKSTEVAPAKAVECIFHSSVRIWEKSGQNGLRSKIKLLFYTSPYIVQVSKKTE